MNDYINVIGGGLAGSEAAYQIATRGIKVKLYEMKPKKFTPAHSNKNLAEIVCSNSFKSNLHTNACGVLKEELRILGSLLIKMADRTSVPAGQALAVDREKFAEEVTKKLRKNKNIEIIEEEVESIEKLAKDAITIIATGPLTSDKLAKDIAKLTNQDKLYFYDAAAPIISKDSINFEIAFWGDRYDQERKKDESIEDWHKRLEERQNGSYINLPMNKEEYEEFWKALVEAEVVKLHDFEKSEIFEGCMPIEIMAKRGENTLRFGPLKPVGFTDPRTGKRPYAVVQLRQDDTEGNIFNMVGFQTNLKFGEQKRVFSKIPGLENAEFVKYGVMHRNTYIDSPRLLDNTYNFDITKSEGTNCKFHVHKFKNDENIKDCELNAHNFKNDENIRSCENIKIEASEIESFEMTKDSKSCDNINMEASESTNYLSNIFFAGQITGVEGYVESISSGMVAALNAINKYYNEPKIVFPKETIIGALADYISQPNARFQPMNANFGIVPELTMEDLKNQGIVLSENMKKRNVAEGTKKEESKIVSEEREEAFKSAEENEKENITELKNAIKIQKDGSIKIKDKKIKYEILGNRALQALDNVIHDA